MTDYNPANYLLHATCYGQGAIELECALCGCENWNNRSVETWINGEEFTIAIANTAAREHHQKHHAPPQCPAVSSPHLGGDQCDDVPDHYGVHTHLRTWWENHDYPAGVGPCTTDRCTKYNGHPGDHHQRPEPGPSPYSEEPPW